MKNPFQRKKSPEERPAESGAAKAEQPEESAAWPGVRAEPADEATTAGASAASSFETPEPEWIPGSQPEPEAAEPTPEPTSEYPPDEFSPDWKPAAVAGAGGAAAAGAAAAVGPEEPSAPQGPDAGDAAIAAAAASATTAAVAAGGKKKGGKTKPPKQPRERKPGLIAWVTGSFKDPVRRPRAIVWTLGAVVLLAGVMVLALGLTSTYWFCANGCHKVQDDTIAAYQASTHNKVSCMACHMPVGASPVTFILHKAEALGELYMTVTNNYELPLNGQSLVSLEMPSTQCSQCHSTNREITPTTGVIIDHKVHAEKKVQCPVCHNRVAHDDEAATPVLNDPTTGEQNRPHDNFMTMNACFRCHSQAKDGLAPGDCAACHPKGFLLKPPSHLRPEFFPDQHGKLAEAETKRVTVAKAREASAAVSGETSAADKEAESESGATKEEVPEGVNLPPVDTINTCYTCHDAETFCNKCHGGVEMPHPPGFTKKHTKIAKETPKACATCHGQGNQGCNSCHHGTALNWNYNPAVPWKKQHPAAVQATGSNPCFDCHAPTYCAKCHVRGN